MCIETLVAAASSLFAGGGAAAGGAAAGGAAAGAGAAGLGTAAAYGVGSALAGAAASKLMAGGKPPPVNQVQPPKPPAITPDVMGRRRLNGSAPATLLTGPGGIGGGTGNTLLGS